MAQKKRERKPTKKSADNSVAAASAESVESQVPQKAQKTEKTQKASSDSPWSIKGVSATARQSAKEKAALSGMTIGAWMTERIVSYVELAKSTDTKADTIAKNAAEAITVVSSANTSASIAERAMESFEQTESGEAAAQDEVLLGPEAQIQALTQQVQELKQALAEISDAAGAKG